MTAEHEQPIVLEFKYRLLKRLILCFSSFFPSHVAESPDGTISTEQLNGGIKWKSVRRKVAHSKHWDDSFSQTF